MSNPSYFLALTCVFNLLTFNGAFKCYKHEYPLAYFENSTGVVRAGVECEYGCMVFHYFTFEYLIKLINFFSFFIGWTCF